MNCSYKEMFLIGICVLFRRCLFYKHCVAILGLGIDRVAFSGSRHRAVLGIDRVDRVAISGSRHRAVLGPRHRSRSDMLFEVGGGREAADFGTVNNNR